jgi:hypothetical protein
VARAFTYSTEHFDLLVNQFYQTFLHRTPSGVEVSAWVSEFQNGATQEEVMAAFLTSAEYRALVAQSGQDFNKAFVQSLYTNLLGRDADGDAIAAWTSFIAQNGLAQAVLGFLTSPEFRMHYVNDLYTDLLHRNGDTSQDELAGWVNTSDDLLQIRAAFAASPEFYANG